MGLEVRLVVSPQAPPEQHPHSQWEGSNFLKSEGGTGTGIPERGQKTQGPQGARKSCWLKMSPAIRPAHPQGPWRAPGHGQLTHPEKRKRISRGTPQCTQRHAQRTTGNHTDMCRHSDPATRPPGTHVYRCAQVCLTVPDCLSRPPALALYQSSNWQDPPGAHT